MKKHLGILTLLLLLLPLTGVAQQKSLTKKQSRERVQALRRLANQDYNVWNYLSGDNNVIVEKGSKFGVVTLDGKVVIPLEYDYITTQQNTRLLAAQKDALVGFLDRQGNVVIPFEYDSHFFGYETDEYFCNGLIPILQKGKYGIIDTNGNVVMPLIYSKCFFPLRKNRRVLITDYNAQPESVRFLLTFDGDTIAGPYSSIDYYSKSNATYRVCRDGKWGFINNAGREIIPCQYDFAMFFNYGLAAVKRNSLWSIIDTAGRTVVPSNRLPLGGRTRWVNTSRNGMLACENNGQCTIIDTSGRIIIPFVSGSFHEITDDRIVLYESDYDVGVIVIYDTAGHLLQKYDDDILAFETDYYNDPIVPVSRDGLSGFVDRRWREVVPCKYKCYVQYVGDKYFYTKLVDGQICLMDTIGQQYFQGPYDYCFRFCEGIFRVSAFSPNNKESLSGFADIYGNTTFSNDELKTLDRWRAERLEKEENETVPLPFVNSDNSDDELDEVFVFVEESPQFPGGDSALYMFICMNLSYPDLARENKIEGKVVVAFVVEKDGSVSHVRLLRDIGGGCGVAAVEVIKNMPRWEPGRQSGEAVNTEFSLPIQFILSDEDDPTNGMSKEERCLYNNPDLFKKE